MGKLETWDVDSPTILFINSTVQRKQKRGEENKRSRKEKKGEHKRERDREKR